MNAIEFQGVFEKYRIKFLKEEKVSWEEVFALQEVSFKVNKGEVLGVIGQNGSGKTTLLKLIAGLILPDRGRIEVGGKVSMLMELGAGFNMEFTGRENIILNVRVYGLAEEAMEQQMGKIIEFANLGRFIDAPIKYYSQGMYMRLAFALAIFVDPDILLIDDILAVGDQEAQQKCIKKIFELKEAGKTIVLVSHDLNMVRRLCDRVILLEKGRIIQEGPVNKVIPYYVETVGDKKGIAVFEEEKLRVIFNNGKIILNYDGDPITKDIGGYLSFFSCAFNANMPSTNLSWRIKSLSSKEIIAEGRSLDGELLQTWKLGLENKHLKWQIEIKEKTAKEPRVDLFFMPQYCEWLTLEGKGEFTQFAHKSNWHDLGIEDFPECTLGIMNPAQKQNALPGIVLEIAEKDTKIKLFNSGYELEARIVQVHSNSNSISMAMRIFTQEEDFNNYINKARSDLIAKKQARNEVWRIQRTILCGNLRLFADTENKAVRLYYKDKEITKGDGLHASFLIDDKWFNILSCEWQIAKNDQLLSIRFFWDAFKLTQTWSFFFKDNFLTWKIESLTDKPLSPDLLKFGLTLSHDYKKYFCGLQQAAFPEKFTLWEDLPLEDPQAELSGLRATDELPALILKNDGGLNCVIQNSDLSSSCRVLQLSVPKGILEKGNDFAFDIKLNLSEDESLIENYVKKKSADFLSEQESKKEKIYKQRTLSCGDIRIFADSDNKAMRIHYKGREITRGLGAHASFMLNKTWYDTSCAEWQVAKEAGRITLVLFWRELKLIQNWVFSLQEDCLFLEVSSDVGQPLKFEIFKFGLLLVPEYETFFCGPQQENFPLDFSVWQDMSLESPKSPMLGLLKNADLPTIAMENSQSLLCVIQTSDAKTCARVLQLSIPRERLNQKNKLDFHSKIRITQEDIKPVRHPRIEMGDFSVFADVQNKAIRIYHKDKEITRGDGLFCGMQQENKNWFHCSDAEWHFNKASQTQLVLSLYYPVLSIKQIWELCLCEETELFFKVKVEAERDTLISSRAVVLQLCDSFTNWQTPSEEGDFSSPRYVNKIAPIRLKEARTSILNVRPQPKADLPALYFQRESQLENFLLNIYKTENENINLKFQTQCKENEKVLSCGQHEFFAGRIIIGKYLDLEKFVLRKNVLELGAGTLGFVFEQGKGRLIWQGKELTSGLGLYTSLRSQGLWHDSSQADWKIIEHSAGTLIATGEWPNIRASQTWRVELKGEGEVLLDIEMDVYEDANLEIYQANLMLSSEYKSWLVGHARKDKFVDEFTQDYDILPFRFWYGKPPKDGIAAENGKLPRIRFMCQSENESLRAIIENTDFVYKSRLLQFQGCVINGLPAGTRLGFTGRVRIEP